MSYKKLEPFRFWCQHVLPTVYDDSLSYYELLCKVVKQLNYMVDNLNDMNEEVTTLVNEVNNYFENLDIQSEVNNKLDSMVADGTLDKIINDKIFNEMKAEYDEKLTGTKTELENEITDVNNNLTLKIETNNVAIKKLNQPVMSKLTTGFVGFNKGWKVMVNRNIVNMSLSRYFTISTTKIAETDLYISPIYKFAIDMPVTEFAFSGISASDNCWLTNVNATKNTISFRVMSNQELTSQRVVIKIEGTGTIGNANDKPSSTPITAGADILKIAKTYLNSKTSGRKYSYGVNFTYNSSDLVNNASGKALMECDTLVVMCLLGIPYADSPYADDTPSLTYEFDNLTVNPTGNYGWAISNIKNDTTYGGRLTATSTLNWYFWGTTGLFKDVNSVADGDIVIFRRDNNQFDYIGHMGVIEKIDGEPYMIHVTSANYSDGEILTRVKLSDFYKYGRYYPEDTYFWRIS